MSSKPASVCATCKKLTKISMACSKCFEICCVTCYSDISLKNDTSLLSKREKKRIKRPKFTLLSIRLCPKCQEDKVSPSRPSSRPSLAFTGEIPKEEQPNVESFPRQAHDLHHAGKVSIVYGEKLSEVRRKLAQAEQLITGLQEDAVTYGWNLEFLENEATAVKGIEAVAESSELLNNLYAKLKIKYASTKQQLDSITSGYDYNYCIMHYKPYLWNLASMIEWHSLNIMDHQGRLWHLVVHPTADQSYIEAYVTLFRGSPTKCSFFIELSHMQPKKSIVNAKTGYFEENMHAGWHQFMTSYELYNDAGYYADGRLHFRFGVRSK